MKDKPVLQLTVTALEDGFLTIITGPSGVPAKYYDKDPKTLGAFLGSVAEKHLVSEWEWYKSQGTPSEAQVLPSFDEPKSRTLE